MIETDQFYLLQTEPNKSCFLSLRQIILSQDSLMSESMKYKMPCFSYKKKMICYLWTDKKTKEPYLLFVDGKRLEHPLLESGNRAKMKIFRVNPNQDLQIQTIENILKRAIDLYR